MACSLHVEMRVLRNKNISPHSPSAPFGVQSFENITTESNDTNVGGKTEKDLKETQIPKLTSIIFTRYTNEEQETQTKYTLSLGIFRISNIG